MVRFSITKRLKLLIGRTPKTAFHHGALFVLGETGTWRLHAPTVQQPRAAPTALSARSMLHAETLWTLDVARGVWTAAHRQRAGSGARW